MKQATRIAILSLGVAAVAGCTNPDGSRNSTGTGGLIGALWAESRKPQLAGMFLNAPWLDMHGSFLLRTAGTRAIEQIGTRRPYQEIPRSVSGLYSRSIHRDHDGEWDFETDWKPLQSWPVYAGWVRAIRRGKLPGFDLVGEGVGFFKIDRASLPALREAVAVSDPESDYEKALDKFVSEHGADYVLVGGRPWTEIDFEKDLERARKDILPRLPKR